MNETIKGMKATVNAMRAQVLALENAAAEIMMAPKPPVVVKRWPRTFGEAQHEARLALEREVM